MVRWIIGASTGAAFGYGTAGKEVAEPPQLCWDGVCVLICCRRELTVCSHSGVLGAACGGLYICCLPALRTGGGTAGRSGRSAVPQHHLVPMGRKPS